MKKANFTIDGETSYEGFHNNERWNGHMCPSFTQEVGEEIVEDFLHTANSSSYAMFDKENDRFIFYQDCDGGEPEYFKGHDFEIDGETKHLYSIGAWSWIWSLEHEPNQESSIDHWYRMEM